MVQQIESTADVTSNAVDRPVPSGCQTDIVNGGDGNPDRINQS